VGTQPAGFILSQHRDLRIGDRCPQEATTLLKTSTTIVNVALPNPYTDLHTHSADYGLNCVVWIYIYTYIYICNCKFHAAK